MPSTDTVQQTRTLRSRIGRRLVGLFVLCSVGPLATLGLLSVQELRSELLHEARSRVHETAKIAASALLQNLERAEEVASRIAARQPQQRLESHLIDSHLIESVEPFRPVEDQNVLVTVTGREIRTDPDVLLHLQTGRTAVIVETVDGRRYVEMLVPDPLSRRGQIRGVVATLAQEEVWAREIAEALDYDLLIYAESGELLFSTLEDDQILTAAVLHAFDENPSSGQFTTLYGGESVVGGYRLLFLEARFGNSWIVAQVQKEESVYRALYRSEQMFVSLAVLSLGLASWIALRQLRRILRPVTQLTEAVRRVAAQDFDVRTDITSGDEFEDLGDAFDAMVAGINLHLRERDRHERLLREARDRALEAARKENEFLQNVSHELRTPMTSIRASAEIVTQFGEEDVEARREFIEIIQKETEHLARLIEDLLDLGRLDSGTFSMRQELVDVERSIREAINAVQSAVSERGSNVQLRVDGQPMVCGDSDRLRQVWTNLLSNAIKFGPEGGTIRVRVHTDEEAVVVDVRDHGCGIADENLEVIFDRFRQVGHDLTTDKPSGTGLGLPIVREILARLGGSVTVKSRLGRGSTFTVRLPLIGEATGIPSETAESAL